MIQLPILNNTPSQTFTVIIDAVEYSIRIIYNTREGVWSMDISCPTWEIDGISLVGGIDLFVQHPDTLSNVFMINISGVTDDADSTNLGIDVVLIIATDEEVAIAEAV